MRESLAIELATDKDYLAIAACARAAYSLYIERIGKAPAPMVADFAAQIAERKIWVLRLQQQLAGFVVCFVQSVHQNKSGVYFLENIAIDPVCQKMGYGKLLVDHVTKLAKDSGCAYVDLYTNELMQENIVWYTKLGFAEVERKREHGFDRVYFRLDL